MAYLLDDQLQHDERFRALRRMPIFAEAFTVYTLIGIYCASERTDGRIFRGHARGLAPSSMRSDEAIVALLDLGFLTEDDASDEYIVVNYLELNESRSEMLVRRRNGAERQRRWAEARKSKKADASPNALGDASNDSVTNSTPVPSSSTQFPDFPPTPLAGGGADGELGLEADSDRPTVRRASAGDRGGTSEGSEHSARPSSMDRFLDSATTPADDVKLQDEIAKAFDRGWRKVHGTSLGVVAKNQRIRLGPLLIWARETDPTDPVDVVERAAQSFASECKSRGDRGPSAPFPAFCAQPGKYLATSVRDSATAAKRQRLDDEIRDLESKLDSERDPDEQLRLDRQITKCKGELLRLNAPEPLGACA